MSDHTHAERSIKLASKLYETRDFLREHFPEPDYSERITEFSKMIKARIRLMPREKTLDAAMAAAKFAKSQGHDGAVGWLMAAAVEMIEAEGEASS